MGLLSGLTKSTEHPSSTALRPQRGGLNLRIMHGSSHELLSMCLVSPKDLDPRRTLVVVTIIRSL